MSESMLVAQEIPQLLDIHLSCSKGQNSVILTNQPPN